MKVYTAAPPDSLRVDEKNTKEYSIPNVCGVVITTNQKSDGIFLPADDRRHFVAWSDLTKEGFTEEYWSRLWAWYHDDGIGHVAAYLAELDISDFNPKAPPPKTDAFWDIVDSGRAVEVSELSDVLDRLGNPMATSLTEIAECADGDFKDWLKERKNRRTIPHRMEAAGYVRVRNDAAKDGLWKVLGKRQALYARKELSLRDRIAATSRITGPGQ
jgi:hypothetical protein